MNSNNFFNQASAISIPNNKDGSLSQPIDIGYQRSGPVFGHTGVNQQQQQQYHNSNSIQHQQLFHQLGNGPNSININSQRNFRRDSIAHSQGVGGISWGSLTIGSWLKDEVMMQNNLNNYTNNQPNHHQTALSPPIQSSYLPDLEANYCKDYSCCGQLLPTLHDLLKHYEESHISPTPPSHQPKPIQNFDTVSTTDVFINSNQRKQQQHAQQHAASQQQQSHQPNQNLQNRSNSSFSFTAPFEHQQQQHHQQQQQQQQQNLQHQQRQNQQQPISHQSSQIQNQQQPNIHQQLRNQFGNSNSSITQQNSQFHFQNLQNTVDSQFNNNNLLNSNISTPRPQQSQQSAPFPISLNNDDNAMDLDEEMDEGYIDDPSRNLYVAQGSEKPFTCPVIGCNKNYKNQNGLKYHRLHGHQNQKLHLNPDGTYSVVDPNDGNGMEQDKPYRCEVCGKRYKNLNGLKYHRGHSTH